MNALLFGPENIRDAVREALKRIDDIDIVGETSKESEVLGLIDSGAAELFLACIDGTQRPYRASQQVYQLRPKTIVMGVTAGGSFAVDTEEALHSGMRHVIEAFGDPAQQTERLHSACEVERSRQSLLSDENFTISDSKVVCVYGPKDGTGKTSLACNVAALLARLGRKTLLLDLDMQFGDCASHLGMNPSRNLTDLLQEGENPTIDRVRQNVSIHSTGLHVLPSLGNIEYADQTTASQIDGVLNTVVGYYDFVIVDLPSALNDIVAACVERAITVLVPVRPTVPSLRHTKRSLILFDLLGAKDKIQCVLSQQKKNDRIGPKDVERVLGIRICVSIPYAVDEVDSALNQGRLISMESPRSDASKAYMSLASAIAGGEVSAGGEKRGNGLIGRLKKRNNAASEFDGRPDKRHGGRRSGRHARGDA